MRIRTSRISRRPSGSTPSVGSSSTTSSGSLTIAAAIPTRCIMPLEYIETLRSAQSTIPTRSSSSSVRARQVARGTRHIAPANSIACLPVRYSGNLCFSGRYPTFPRTDLVPIGDPRIVPLALVARTTVSMILTSVLFPAPFGPSRPKTSPRLASILMPRNASTPPRYTFLTSERSIARSTPVSVDPAIASAYPESPSIASVESSGMK